MSPKKLRDRENKREMRFRVDVPLSKTRYHDLIRDMKAVVDRPLEQRQLEAALAGWVRRPMNGFMLYRRAYTLVVEKEYGATKQQEISQVCGASWKLEPAAVREKYESLGISANPTASPPSDHVIE